MIPLCGIAIMIAVVVLKVWYEIHGQPTNEEEANMVNKLNRMALDRANEMKNP
jgi:hypothetical protein